MFVWFFFIVDNVESLIYNRWRTDWSLKYIYIVAYTTTHKVLYKYLWIVFCNILIRTIVSFSFYFSFFSSIYIYFNVNIVWINITLAHSPFHQDKSISKVDLLYKRMFELFWLIQSRWWVPWYTCRIYISNPIFDIFLHKIIWYERYRNKFRIFYW